MKAHQLIGFTLNATSAITAIVGASTQSRIFYADRPRSSALSILPAITYLDLSGGSRDRGMVNKTFQINCWAITPAAARDLAEKVIDVFSGSAGVGIQISGDGFDARTFVIRDNGLIPEPDGFAYNAPLDLMIVYPYGSVT